MFTINLATRIYIDKKLLGFCTAAAVILSTSFLCLGVWHIKRNSVEMKDLAKQLAVMDEKIKTANKGLAEKDYKNLQERINFANSVIVKKTYNWVSLFDKLEKVVPDGVAVSSIEPDPKTRDIRIAGMARSFRNLRVFMERMEDSRLFTDLYITNQGESRLADNSQVVTFNLVCKVAAK